MPLKRGALRFRGSGARGIRGISGFPGAFRDKARLRAALRLYLCTDRILSLGRPIGETIAAAAAGGVTMVQLREKEASSRDFYEIALELRALTRSLGIPLVINDRLDIALAVGAEGLHIGQSDLPLKKARQLAGRNLFIGISAGTVGEALAAEREGADYLGAGAVYPTGSKADAGKAIGIKGLAAICAAVRIPVIGIGGLNAGNAGEALRAGAAGVAVISAILSQPDMEEAARRLREAVDRASPRGS
ncbi:MAG: thiamine phosphate synthase [Treponema sp.]|jgi:thiamine-phosphate pyrophosphorylase|nr:thiamine phosphate synthase [Treponema sp.]